MKRLHQFNETNTPAQPEAEDATPSVAAFIAAIEDSASIEKTERGSLRKNEEESCTEAIICVGEECWQDSKECTSDSSSDESGDSSDGSNDDSSNDSNDDSSNDQNSGNDNQDQEGGGGGPPPSDDDNGDGGESPDPCVDAKTSLCETSPEREKKIPQIQDFSPADTIKIDELPDCRSGSPNDLKHPEDEEEMWRDYCESSLPNSEQKQHIKTALQRIKNHGKECAQIAQRARTYLSKDLIYLDPTANRASGHGNKGLVIIWEAFADSFRGNYTKEDEGYARDGNLQSILVHEFDHVLGEKSHLPGTFRTSHVEQCSNITF